jgi:sulfur-oxidizing protein SoxY
VPDIAENGAVVPIAASVAVPGARRIGFVVEKNPTALAAVFDIGDTVEPNIVTRLKMAQTSNVFAFAVLADCRVLFARQEVKVTLGGCAA